MFSDLKFEYRILKSTLVPMPEALLNCFSRYVVHMSTNKAKMKNKIIKVVMSMMIVLIAVVRMNPSSLSLPHGQPKQSP